MMVTRSIAFEYDAPPELVWRINTRFESFARLMGRLVRFDGLPKGRAEQGQRLDLKARLWGVLPPMKWRIEIAEIDHDAMRFRSIERGGPIRHWAHLGVTEATNHGCRVTDTVTADAGPLNPLLPLWIKMVYHTRHKPRLEMIREAMVDGV